MNNRRNELLLVSAKEYCKCVVEGKTIKYNQIANILNDSGTYYGMSYSSNTNGTITISGTSNYTGGDSNIYTIIANFTQKAGHKLLCYSTSSIFQILLYDNHGNYVGNQRQYAYIVQCQYNDDMYASIMPYYIDLISNGATINETFNVMIIDLTELGLDNVNSVADFYETDLGKYILKGNYLSATNGAFIQANTPINFKGVNIWNEHWENGIWYEGNFYSSGYEDFICSVDMIKVKPNKEYFYFNNSSNTDCYIVYEMYDKDKNYISRDYCENKHSFRTTNDCEYVLFYVNDTYGNKYNYDICISENIWNEKYDNGYYVSGTKTFVSDSGLICSKSEIKVKPNTKYYFSCSYYNVIYFFNNDTYIDSVICSNNSFTTPNNCNNIVFMTNTSTYNNDIGIFYYGYHRYCSKTIKVYSIEYNEQIKNGNFATTSDWVVENARLNVSDNVGTINSIYSGGKISQSIKLVANHKYAIMYIAKVNIAFTMCKLSIGGNVIENNFMVYGAGADWQNFGWIWSNSGGLTNTTLELLINLSGNFIGDYRDYFYIKEFNIIDLTALGMDSITTISDFKNTDLGQVIVENGYLPYSHENTRFALKTQFQKGDYYKTYSVAKVSYNNLNLTPNGTITGWNVIASANVVSGHKYLIHNVYSRQSQSQQDTDYQVYIDGILSEYIYNINATKDSIVVATQTGTCYFNSATYDNYVSGVQYYIAVIDLTLLGLDNITSVADFHKTPLGMLLAKGYYLPYTTSNKEIKPQLIRTMKEIDLDDLTWGSEDFGYYAPLPSDCKTYDYTELPNILAEKYGTAKYYDEIQNTMCIYDVYGYGWCLVFRYGTSAPTGKLLYELSTPIIIDEDIEDIMVSRRTINVESDNGVDLDFTKE